MKIPDHIADEFAGPIFEPAPELERWVRATIIEPGALFNPDHKHLQLATIGFLWTNVENTKQGRMIAGTAQFGRPGGSSPWVKGKAEQQMRQWFGHLPDFLITLNAKILSLCDQATVLAVIEHELYHCAQAKDEFGFPRFKESDNSPIWAIRGHDVEEFVGVVQRYGMEAAQIEPLVRATNSEPMIGRAKVAAACGTCLRVAN